MRFLFRKQLERNPFDKVRVCHCEHFSHEIVRMLTPNKDFIF